MGSLYRRGKVWWVKYYRDGKPYRESSGSLSKRDGQKLLKRREGAVATGTFAGLKPEKTTLDDLVRDLLNDYSNNSRKALPMVRYYVERLRDHFSPARACQVTTDRIREYVATRLAQTTKNGRAPTNATVNRELAALKRMFNLGRQAGKVVSVPHIPMLAERNVRKGFFHPRDYLRLKKELPAQLRPVITLAHFSGMRKGEILSLTWRQVDFQARVIQLDPGTTKNEEPRIIPMSEELLEELKAQRQLRDERFPFCQQVFFNHNTGKPIKDFRGSWATACKKIGLPSALFHDLRRTGVRNLIRAGVPERVAMTISGHKTRSVFDRYNIVDEDDVKAAAKAVEAYLDNATGTIRAQITELADERKKRRRAK